MSPTLTETLLSDPTVWWTAGTIALLLALSGFFSGSETALTAASRFKLKAMSDQGSAGAEKAMRLTDDNERLIGSVLLGNNLVNILATSLATSLLTVLFGDSGVIVATAIMTALVLVFAEVMPKTYAIPQPETAASRVAPIIAVVVAVLSPIVRAVQILVRFTLRLVGVQTDPNTNVLAAQEEIAGAIALHHSEGGMLKDDKDRLLGALDLKSREIEEIMLHRSNIEMIDADANPQDILAQALRSPYTRIPVFREDPENIIGVLHAKDLLRSLEPLLKSDTTKRPDFDIHAVMMKPYFVPETTTLNDQMIEFLRRHAHFALVVDEYGALQGLITLEDIIEEIIGEISDEHDETIEELDRDGDGSYLIDGAMTIRDVNRACEWDLPDEEANTLAGLIIHEAQTIPTVGQVFSYHGFRFEVIERERNRLTKIKVRPLI
jgi:Mg2+/Co2+ transporter CorB